jgi:hypothetical protein
MTQPMIAMEMLRHRLRQRYGSHADLALVAVSLQSKLESKILDEIDAIIGTYSVDQLAEAIEANAELELVERQASRQDGRQ